MTVSGTTTSSTSELDATVKSWTLSKSTQRRLLFICIGAALLVRLLVAFVLPDEMRITSDAQLYIDITHNILNAGEFTNTLGEPYAHVPPGYPFFLATIFSMTGNSLLMVAVIQAILGAFSVWLLYQIGREIIGEIGALLGAFIYGFYPAWMIWPARYLTETLYTMLILLFIWSFIRSLRRDSLGLIILAGITFGFTMLTREVLSLFPLVLPVILWWVRKPFLQSLSYIAIFLIAMILTLSPWLIRNYVVLDALFFTARTDAIRYRFTGTGYLSDRYQYLKDNNATVSEKYPGFHAKYGIPGQTTSIRFAMSNPQRYLEILRNRFVEVWFHPNGLYSMPSVVVLRWGLIGFHALILLFALIGSVRGLLKRDNATGIFVMVLFYITSVIVFISAPNPRYTMPFLPLVFMLASGGILYLTTSVPIEKHVR